MAMALTACGSDDEILNDVQRGDRHPLQLTATVEDIQTRVTGDNKWEDGDVIGVKISNDPNNTIGQYKLNADGTVKEVIKGVEWQGTEPATVTAWYPYAESVKRKNISNQQDGYTAHDILRAETKGSSAAPVDLVFKHQMAKVRCRLKATYEGRDISISGATVKFNSVILIIVENGEVRKEGYSGEITSYEDSESGVTTYTALLPPQTVTAGTQLIKITIGDKTVYYKPAQNITLEAGKSYNYNIKIADVPDNTIDSKGTYHVYKAEGLKAWAEAVKDNPAINCILEENITMSGNWTPISSFTGTFDGNEHTISGLKVNLTNESRAGFIGKLEDGGTVKNLTLENVKITGKYNPTGGVAGYCNGGTIENCHVTGTGRISVTEESTASEIGGIVGSNSNGTILACHVSKEYSVGTDATMAQTFITGGIAGTNSGGTIKGCYALCSLSGTNVGGICGRNSTYDDTESSYIACYSNCRYNASGNAGGILGSFSENPTFTQCYYQNGVDSGVGGESDNKHNGVVSVFDTDSWQNLKYDMLMNEALGEDFGYKYLVNGNPISQDEPLILVKKQ